MDKSIKCECGNEQFWFFGQFVRCPKCFSEIKQVKTGRKKVIENWIRRFNNEEHKYSNWEHFDISA